ncbi:MAG TPA: LLM class flavin-dependent oxidoreductase [Ktedonobacteraceae bacterium]|nr:LLM class flavin-dependent oxidoreductase [Ktedonobacteraceae bacterium]
MRFSIFSVTDHYPRQSRSIREFYNQMLDEIELADRLGFSAFFMAEHHFHEYGIVPSPTTLLAAAAERTQHIGLGVAVSTLPFHNPLLLAEEYAMLDQLSNGRLVLGVGSGYLKHEFEGFQIGPWEKRVRFDDALEILLRAWQGEPFSYHGLYHHIENTRIAVTPLQKPHPPYWIAILRPEAAYYVGKQGRNIMLIPYATCETRKDLDDVVENYRLGRAEATMTETEQPDVAVALHTYVSASPDRTRSESEEALNNYVSTRLYAKRRSYEQLEAAGLILFGDAQQVTEQVRQLEASGLNHLMILVDFGALPFERVHASMERFAHEVMPHFQKTGATL